MEWGLLSKKGVMNRYTIRYTNTRDPSILEAHQMQLQGDYVVFHSTGKELIAVVPMKDVHSIKKRGGKRLR